MEQEGNLDVLPLFEKAVGVVLEVKHLITSLTTVYFNYTFSATSYIKVV